MNLGYLSLYEQTDENFEDLNDEVKKNNNYVLQPISFGLLDSFKTVNPTRKKEKVNERIKEQGRGFTSYSQTSFASSETCDVESKASKKLNKYLLELTFSGTSRAELLVTCYNLFFLKCQDGQPHSSGALMEDNKKCYKLNRNHKNKNYSDKELTEYIPKTIGTSFKRLFLYLQLLLCISVSTCDYHSLSYYHSGVSERIPGLPQFMAVGYVDDEQIDSYNSDTRELIPVTKWIENNKDASYWKRQTTYRRGWEEVFKDDLMILNGRFNKTADLHTFQLMYNCGLDDDGNTEGHYQYGFDGGNFIDLETNGLLWVPYTHEAEISTQRWNREQHVANRVHSYLKDGCIKALKNYISLAGKERKVLPQVKVSGHQSDTVTKLHCWVYGFYPKAVDVKWVKNEEICLMSEEATQVLPNPDGTYQLRVTVEVIPKDGDSFSCHVDHSSLKEPLTVLWEPNKSHFHLYIIVGVIVPVVLIAAVVGGYFVYRKKKPYTKAPNKDYDSSPASSTTA